MRKSPTLIIAILMAVVAPASAIAAPASSVSGSAFFESKVRPVLVANCYQCHSAKAEKLKGKLLLDSREGLLKGGSSGPAIVPGNPEKSLLVKAINWVDPDTQMPPKQKLSGQQIADLTAWVKMGAPWGGASARPLPTDKYADPASRYDQTRRTHWAYQPVKLVPAPAVKNAGWATGDIDRFILAKLEQAGLRPSPPCDRRTLLRRVTFDLTGLPPTPEEVDAFLADASPDALAKVVDRLLASPAFGERWGRHWLDVARYAESTGMSRNYPLYYAWRYRDYVVDALNKDKPYNQFVTEQLAGDLLSAHAKTPAQKDEQIIATGFLALGPKDLNEKNRFQYVMNNVDEQIDVTGKAFLGTTIACARCHDHKFDPVPQTEYYSMAGIFRSTEILASVEARRGKADRADPELFLQLNGDGRPPVAGAAGPGAGRAAGGPGGVVRPIADVSPKPTGKRPAAKANGAAAAARAEQDAAPADERAIRPLALGVRDEATLTDCNVLQRGEIDNPGPLVHRGVINLPGVRRPQVPPAHSGRLELAQWITDPANPLAARVMANRIWQHLFGDGLVRTVDNFGTTGEAPSHPELLDYLANQFVKNGWSVKRQVRAIVLSSAYQQASVADPAGMAADPDDRLVWRMQPRRLEAEAIRDAMLAVAGNLDTERPLASPVQNAPAIDIGKRARLTGGAIGEVNPHRSVYLPILRGLEPEVLDVFDMADTSLETGQRDVTTVAPQALFMMNDPFVMAQARGLAGRVLESPGLDDGGRVDRAYRRAVGRPATAADRARALAYLNACMHPRERGQSMDEPAAWASFCQALMASAEFRYVN